MQEPFDSKFSALDLNNKQILIGDVVKIAKGPSEVYLLIYHPVCFCSTFLSHDLVVKLCKSFLLLMHKIQFQGKQGVVRQVYRGIIFLYAEGEEENGGYLCCKSQSCEKVKLFTEESNDKVRYSPVPANDRSSCSNDVLFFLSDWWI